MPAPGLLSVVFRHQGIGQASIINPAAGHRIHHQAVSEREQAHMQDSKSDFPAMVPPEHRHNDSRLGVSLRGTDRLRKVTPIGSCAFSLRSCLRPSEGPMMDVRGTALKNKEAQLRGWASLEKAKRRDPHFTARPPKVSQNWGFQSESPSFTKSRRALTSTAPWSPVKKRMPTWGPKVVSWLSSEPPP